MDATAGRGAASAGRTLDAATIEAVVFDLDGVLVDSQIWWREVRDAWAGRRGVEWSDEAERATMGANTRQWVRIMRERTGLSPEDEAEIERTIVGGLLGRYRERGAPLIPGATESARRIAGRYPTAVASGAHPRIIATALEAAGLSDAVSVVVSADDVPRGKPEPDIYLEASRRLGVPPGRCLVVEDSANGLRAARAAGMVVALVPNAAVPPEAGAAGLADLVAGSLAELANLLLDPSSRGEHAAEAGS